MSKLLPIIMIAGVASLVLSLLIGGFIVYQWVLACEATAASVALLACYVRFYHHDPRKSKWPPLLPLALIGAAVARKASSSLRVKIRRWRW